MIKVFVLDYVIEHFQGEIYKEFMSRLHISIFMENNLSDNVISDSAAMYNYLALQYPNYHDNFICVHDTLRAMISSPEFHKVCDTAQYEYFIPAEYYTLQCNTNGIAAIEKIIQKIRMRCLRQRMLRGLQEYKKDTMPVQTSDHSEPDIEDDIGNCAEEVDNEDDEYF